MILADLKRKRRWSIRLPPFLGDMLHAFTLLAAVFCLAWIMLHLVQPLLFGLDGVAGQYD